jgi:NAD(P)H-hydrate repair Nnr-like enzyme with NAD(P)H-hydrate dehydratase domain
MVAGLVAQNPDRALSAVMAAVHLHGLSGDIARDHLGEHSLIATDLLVALPGAFRRTREAGEKSFQEIQG